VPELELTTSGVAAGGEMVARDEGGRVVFVTGALPGERVRVSVTDERARFARGHVVEVIDAAPERTAPPCPHVERGCGGCLWQHATPAAQRAMKARIVTDALERIGRIAEPLVDPGAPLSAVGYRTTVRLAATGGGGFGFRRHHDHRVVGIDSCLVAHPLVEEVLAGSRLGRAREVTIRVGARTGQRLVVADPSARGVVVPGGVRLVGTDQLRSGRRAWFQEEVAGRSWRISALSFFQVRPDGAEALVATTREALGDALVEGAHLFDAYCGVGLFAGALATGPVTAVELSASAVADARANLADLDARVHRADVANWQPGPADVAVADPARAGLGAGGVGTLRATGARRIALVSCDPASLGRDAGLLAGAGYRHVSSTLVDLFPHTPHVEVVSRFDRGDDGGVEGRGPGRPSSGAGGGSVECAHG
jgi:23S rRNA (uracil1939-C5)-methyltransferase